MRNHEAFTSIPHPWPDLIKFYGTGKLSQAQLLDQLLIWGQKQHEDSLVQQRQLEEQEVLIADLAAQVAELKEEKGSLKQ